MGAALRRRGPYLEQILRERVLGGLLTRYRADCHVDGRTHSFTGRHPQPPCTGDHGTCALYRRAVAAENARIDHLTD